MKSLELTTTMLQELGVKYSIETTRDRKTVSERCAKEGESFLTITLPNLEKALLTALDQGFFVSDLWPGFRRGKGGLPAFMQGFLRRIFARHEGGKWYIENDSVTVASLVRDLRQVLALHGKIFRVCSPTRERQAKRQFVETDRALDYTLSPLVMELFQELYGEALHRVEKRLFDGDGLVMKHGPGAVAERLSQNQKWTFPYWTTALQSVLPWWESIRTPGEVICEGDDAAPEMLDAKPSSRLVSVPKTAKAPRLIAIEPVAHQFVQQGLFSLIEDEVCKTPVWRAINWRDQERNRNLAREGSRDGRLATIDLSEASDRVSWGLVKDLLSRHRYLLRWIDACRSESIDVDGSNLSLKKFASMGSALTFPIETMVFYAIALAGVVENVPEARRLARSDEVKVSAYGDDIVVPASKMHKVVSTLEAHGFRVNAAKSFGLGLFRESCGGDYFAGVDVGIVRVRAAVDDSRTPEWVEKTLNLRNRLFDAGYYGCTSVVDKWLGDNVPYLPVGHPSLGRWTYDEEKLTSRFNSDLQRLEYRSLVIRRNKPSDPLSGWAALRKCLIPRRGKT